MMERFYIVTNDGKDPDYIVTDHVRDVLESAGKICCMSQKDESKRIIKETIDI